MRITSKQFHDLVTGRTTGLWPTTLRTALAAAEVPYRAAVAARNYYYDRSQAAVSRVDVPVISVGNLTMGGTGKTPMVAWLARWFRARQVRVAILSRGYGAEAGAVNDEALELEERLPDVPHLQNSNRVQSAQVAIHELASQLLILDDGFQHRRLHRDLDIVLIDASQPVAFQRLVPRGFYREPPAGLGRAHCVVLTRCDMVSPEQIAWLRDFALQRNSQLEVVEATHEAVELINASGHVVPLEAVQGQRVAAFCGIGHPGAFWHTLSAIGCLDGDRQAFPDHHVYSAQEMTTMQAWANEANIEAVLCTHKDLVKVGVDQLGGKPLYAVRVEMKLNGVERLESLLQQHLPQVPTGPC